MIFFPKGTGFGTGFEGIRDNNSGEQEIQCLRTRFNGFSNIFESTRDYAKYNGCGVLFLGRRLKNGTAKDR